MPGVAAAMGEIDALGSLVKFDNGAKRVGSTGGAPPLVFSTPPPALRPGMFVERALRHAHAARSR